MRITSLPQREDVRLVLKFPKSKSKNIVTNFHSLNTVYKYMCVYGIMPVFHTRTCTYKFFWYFTKELVRNKHVAEELLAKIKDVKELSFLIFLPKLTGCNLGSLVSKILKQMFIK